MTTARPGARSTLADDRSDPVRNPVTHDMIIAILRDEERHRRLVEGDRRECETS